MNSFKALHVCYDFYCIFQTTGDKGYFIMLHFLLQKCQMQNKKEEARK